MESESLENLLYRVTSKSSRIDRGLRFSLGINADGANTSFFHRQLGISDFSASEVVEIVMTCKGNGWVRDIATQPSTRECEGS